MAYIAPLIASAIFFGTASAQETTTTTAAPAKDEKEFPLVWVCLGITVVGVIGALYVAHRRPDEFHLPGSTVMVATENEAAGNSKEPTRNNGALNDDLEAV